jgi:hypothetical protein
LEGQAFTLRATLNFVKKTRKKGDSAQRAWAVVQEAIGESPDKLEESAAVTSGRKGGKIGGPARAAKMTEEERSQAARKAVTARWERSRKNSKRV